MHPWRLDSLRIADVMVASELPGVQSTRRAPNCPAHVHALGLMLHSH